MSESLEQRIMRHEGLRLRPYADTLGKLTIGYGRCLTTNGISTDEAMQLLENDIDEAKIAMNQSFPWVLGLDDVRQGVIIEMIFQLGVAGVQGFPKMIAEIREKDYNIAAKEMLNSVWHSQTPDRCEELANLMLNGDQPTT